MSASWFVVSTYSTWITGSKFIWSTTTNQKPFCGIGNRVIVGLRPWTRYLTVPLSSKVYKKRHGGKICRPPPNVWQIPLLAQTTFGPDHFLVVSSLCKSGVPKVGALKGGPEGGAPKGGAPNLEKWGPGWWGPEGGATRRVQAQTRFLGYRVKPRRPQSRRTFQGPVASNTTKIPRKDPQVRKKANSGGRGKKKREILGGPVEGCRKGCRKGSRGERPNLGRTHENLEHTPHRHTPQTHHTTDTPQHNTTQQHNNNGGVTEWSWARGSGARRSMAHKNKTQATNQGFLGQRWFARFDQKKVVRAKSGHCQMFPPRRKRSRLCDCLMDFHAFYATGLSCTVPLAATVLSVLTHVTPQKTNPTEPTQEIHPFQHSDQKYDL